MTDILTRPSILQASLYCAVISIGRLRFIVPFITVFAKCDTSTFRIADIVVLNDPALGPMRADQSDLLGCRRRPGRSGMHDCKTAHCNEVSPRLIRVEKRLPHVDFNIFFVGVDIFKLRPDRCLRLRNLGEPSCFSLDWLEYILFPFSLKQPELSKIDRSCVMIPAHPFKPVTRD